MQPARPRVNASTDTGADGIASRFGSAPTYLTGPPGLIGPLLIVLVAMNTLFHGCAYAFVWKRIFLTEQGSAPFALYALCASCFYSIIVAHVVTVPRLMRHVVGGGLRCQQRKRFNRAAFAFLLAVAPPTACNGALLNTNLNVGTAQNSLIAFAWFVMAFGSLSGFLCIWYTWTTAVADWLQRGVRMAADVVWANRSALPNNVQFSTPVSPLIDPVELAVHEA